MILDEYFKINYNHSVGFEMSQSKLIPVLVKAVQELSQQNQELKTIVDSIVEKT